MAIGERLQATRLDRRLTLEDISRATCIRPGILAAIEAEDFGACGGSVYARGHLRTFAGALRLDPTLLVDEYDERFGVPPPPLAPRVLRPDEAATAERSRPNWAGAATAALVVVCVLAGVQLLRPTDRPAPRAGSGVHPAVAQARVAPPPVRVAPARPVVPVVPVAAVTVALRITGDASWVSVRNGAKTALYSGLLSAGQRMVFRDASRLRLTLGNAGAVGLVVNGRDLGAAGKPGDVTRVAFGPGVPAPLAG